LKGKYEIREMIIKIVVRRISHLLLAIGSACFAIYLVVTIDTSKFELDIRAIFIFALFALTCFSFIQLSLFFAPTAKQSREKIIKIIDWMSKIIPILVGLLIISGSPLVRARERLEEKIIMAIIWVLLPFSPLFFAPDARRKGIIWIVVIIILMLPGLGMILLSLYPEQPISHISLKGVWFYGTMGLGLIVYIFQYYLLFNELLKITIKGTKEICEKVYCLWETKILKRSMYSKNN